MSEIQLPIIITKVGCDRCHELKEWMKKNDLKYVEKSIDDEEFTHQLLHDKNFVNLFCDAESCIVHTPIVMYKGKYWFKELWGVSGLREKEAKKIFKDLFKMKS